MGPIQQFNWSYGPLLVNLINLGGGGAFAIKSGPGTGPLIVPERHSRC